VKSARRFTPEGPKCRERSGGIVFLSPRVACGKRAKQACRDSVRGSRNASREGGGLRFHLHRPILLMWSPSSGLTAEISRLFSGELGAHLLAVGCLIARHGREASRFFFLRRGGSWAWAPAPSSESQIVAQAPSMDDRQALRFARRSTPSVLRLGSPDPAFACRRPSHKRSCSHPFPVRLTTLDHSASEAESGWHLRSARNIVPLLSNSRSSRTPLRFCTKLFDLRLVSLVAKKLRGHFQAGVLRGSHPFFHCSGGQLVPVELQAHILILRHGAGDQYKNDASLVMNRLRFISKIFPCAILTWRRRSPAPNRAPVSPCGPHIGGLKGPAASISKPLSPPANPFRRARRGRDGHRRIEDTLGKTNGGCPRRNTSRRSSSNGSLRNSSPSRSSLPRSTAAIDGDCSYLQRNTQQLGDFGRSVLLKTANDDHARTLRREAIRRRSTPAANGRR